MAETSPAPATTGLGGIVARNTAYLSGALVVQKLIAFVYFTVIARLIGTAHTGEYVWPIAFATIFSIIADFGLSPVLIREVARRKDLATAYLRNALMIKLTLALVAYALMVIALHWVDAYVVFLGFKSLNQSLVLVAGVVMLLDSFTLTFYAIFRGFQKLQYEALGSVINKIIVATVGIIAVKLGFSVIFLLFAILVGSVFNVLYASLMLVKKLGVRPGLSLQRPIARELLRIALPFAAAALFVNIYANFDTVFLRVRAGESYAGWYVVAYKLTFALQFIPAAFAAAIFPAMSEYFVTARERLANIFERSMSYLMIVATPLAIGLFVLADKIIITMYKPAFEASIDPFRILMGAMLAVFLNYPVGYILNACNRQGINTFNMGVTMLVNILLNIILIPRYTFNGAAIAALVSSWLLFLLGLFWVRTITPYRVGYLWLMLAKILSSGFLMGGVVYALHDPLFAALAWLPLAGAKFEFLIMGLLAAMGALLYFGVLYALRGFSRADVRYILDAFLRRRKRATSAV